MRKIDEIIIHCSATQPNWASDKSAEWKRDEIRRWHVGGNGWSDIGYHWLVDRSGEEVMGRPVAKAGAHCKGHNANSIGICLIGGHGSSADDEFSDHFTIAQDKALRELIVELQEEYPTITKISGHNEYAAKACPGFRVSEWLRDAPPAVDVEPVDPITNEPLTIEHIRSWLCKILNCK